LWPRTRIVALRAWACEFQCRLVGGADRADDANVAVAVKGRFAGSRSVEDPAPDKLVDARRGEGPDFDGGGDSRTS
jgi:hypothetical protein